MSAAARLWKRLVEEAGQASIDAAAKVPASDAERELKAAGFDTNAERAKAEAVIAALTAASASSKEEPNADGARETLGWSSTPAQPATRSRASSRVVWLVAALMVAALAGGIFYALGRRPKPPDVPPEPPRPAPTASATPTPAPEPTAPSTAAPDEPPVPFRKWPAPRPNP